MKPYLREATEVLNELQSGLTGLSRDEAAQRLAANGKNKLKEAPKASAFQRFIGELKDPMLLVLLAASAVSAVTAVISREVPTDAIIILIVVLLNALLGVYQEGKAEKAIEALQEMSAAHSQVLREGHVLQVLSEDLVVGDILILEAGTAVPADCRVIEQASLQCEEAALTGESLPVTKQVQGIHLSANAQDVPLGDRKNMAYSGSTVVYGRGKAVVTAVGMDTEMGKIATAITNTVDQETPLQLKLGQLSRVLTYMVLGICAFIFVFSLVRGGKFDLDGILSTFLIAVSLAVAAIPEGLATVVTIVLSIGVTNMSRRNAVIRRLTAVETLGSTQIICSDKTGTLTQNLMTVMEYEGADERLLARALALCCDSEWEDGEAVGEPTENALVAYAAQLGMPKDELKKEAPRQAEAPFDSVRKMMSVFCREPSGLRQYVKGAPDVLLERCDAWWDGREMKPLDPEKRQQILAHNKRMADEALRVLAAAFSPLSALPEDLSPDQHEKGLCYLGLVGMLDPVRPEVIDAVAECRSAGIRPVMITGDHKDTAVAIAKRLKMLSSAQEALTGAELDQISDEELDKTIDRYCVYARVQPEHKVRIVSAWQARGRVTAMTGDGVNDAPSIKKADIGIGMGITGTDVTKNVADMVLADDNFATIVAAVEEGRRIYDNIRKAIQFLLSSNLSEVICVFVATMLGFTILRPAHLLWINLITDTFPALSLGMEKPSSEGMSRPPRPKNEGVFAGGLGFDAVYQGVLVSLLTLAAYLLGHLMESGRLEFVNSPDGMTMAFLTMSLSEVFHALNMRSQRGSVLKLKTHNPYLYGAMLITLILTATVIYVPFLSRAFGFTAISLAEYLVALGLAVSVIPIVEIIKWLQRKLPSK